MFANMRDSAWVDDIIMAFSVVNITGKFMIKSFGIYNNKLSYIIKTRLSKHVMYEKSIDTLSNVKG